MTTTIRSARRTGYPALMVFGIVYLATLAIVFTPESLRAGSHAPGTAASQAAKGTP